MIKILVDSKKVIISGHANYSNGEDIVCASVSSIMYTSVNAILRFDKNAITYQDDGNKVIITVNSNDKITETLIDNMVSLYKELETKYPKNIKIDMEE